MSELPETSSPISSPAAAHDAPRALSLVSLQKRFAAKTVLENISATVAPGSCLALLGPSGSGKSTLLNLIAGFERPDDGDIRLGDDSILALPPHRRRIGVVFQHYALFPHLNVAENIAYPLIRRRIAAPERRRRIDRLLTSVGLEGFAGQSVRTLSGGQQQRVAIARALAAEPEILLMDEPMGALDRTLRDRLQVELKVLLDEVGATVVYVTHDQREAIAMADTIAVLNRGRIEQKAATEEIYAQPQTAFVAGFLWPGANRLRGTIQSDSAPGAEGRTAVRIGSQTVSGRWAMPRSVPQPDESVDVIVRPESLRLAPPATGSAALAGRITASIFAGSHRTLQLRLEHGATLTAEQPLSSPWRAGDAVEIAWAPEEARVYRAETGETE